MPRKQRNQSEFEAVKNTILQNALTLMNKAGFEGFTMKKLAQMMGVTTPAIYSYYRNKDELYLGILTAGFEMLFQKLKQACRECTDPFDKLKALIEAYMDFGLGNANFYNLMFTWHVPKYNDYIGTAQEEVAHRELVTALQVTNLALAMIKECAAAAGRPLAEEDARFYLVQNWSTVHGYIAGVNNELIHYMHESPLSVRDRMLDAMAAGFRGEMEQRSRR
ncbi:MAG: TetR/AcrR family transcriptional regulator [Thermodesulfobacteriota bacterium]